MTNIDQAAERALVLAIQSSAVGSTSGAILAAAADFRHFLLQDDPVAISDVVNQAQAVVDAYNGVTPQTSLPDTVSELEDRLNTLRNPA